MATHDVIVIGGGIAGVSIGYELADGRKVVLLEMESSLAYHTTGRSAATFLETYGGPQVRALTTASRAFLSEPSELFEGDLLSPRGLVYWVQPGKSDILRNLQAEVSTLVPDVELLDLDQAFELFPLLNRDVFEIGMYEPGAMDIDAIGLHGGYARGLRQRGGEIVKNASVTSVEHHGSEWLVRDASGRSWQAPLVVNAAGAWGDKIARMAGLDGVGLVPYTRSIFMVGSPLGADSRRLPGFGDVEGSYYTFPEGEQFLCSPADETPGEPGDVSADQLEIARAIDALNYSTTIKARSVRTTWAGQRTSAPDHEFVVGLDPAVDGFMWFVGQGGYGIQTAPANARLGAALVAGAPLPEDLRERGFDVAKVAPRRDMSATSH